MAGRRAIQIVWFKRDLRVDDHAPLAQAAALGPVLALYAFEPEHVESAEFDAAHLRFIDESLVELDASLRARGIALTLRIGSMPEILERLCGELAPHGEIAGLWSHEETGLQWSFARDRRVARWCEDRAIPWHELPPHGVVRRLASRDGWSARWARTMRGPLVEPPEHIVSAVDRAFDHGARPSAAELGLAASTKPDAQRGGRAAGVAMLESFLSRRGVNYRADMSSPVEGWDGCSRLSPHLAWGTVSVREVYQATVRRKADLRESSTRDPRWLKSLASFEGRLRWHCHFIQKLEDEPAIEFHNMSRAYDGMREDDFDEQRFTAWCEARTGYPMVDACMRCLQATGWLNFRMRAMLVSFSSYHLWLHWREPAVFLARHFLDFEPGIHFSQFQMQSGVTGINTPRIYSPKKQLLDQDPSGDFVRRWLPELAGVPDAHLAEPHLMSAAEQRSSGCRIDRDYPAPIVDHATAYRDARARLWRVKSSPEARSAAQSVYQKHGSRRRPPRPVRRT